MLMLSRNFSQVLSPNEKYILRPPDGDPTTSPGTTYWIIKRMLYILKRSPWNWFNLAVSFLRQCGLTSCPHDPCIFQGHPILRNPKLYLGLYVDDLSTLVKMGM